MGSSIFHFVQESTNWGQKRIFGTAPPIFAYNELDRAIVQINGQDGVSEGENPSLLTQKGFRQEVRTEVRGVLVVGDVGGD